MLCFASFFNFSYSSSFCSLTNSYFKYSSSYNLSLSFYLRFYLILRDSLEDYFSSENEDSAAIIWASSWSPKCLGSSLESWLLFLKNYWLTRQPFPWLFILLCVCKFWFTWSTEFHSNRELLDWLSWNFWFCWKDFLLKEHRFWLWHLMWLILDYFILLF